MEMRKFNYMLEIDILRNSSLKKIGCPEGCFLRVWVSKKALAKTMLLHIVEEVVKCMQWHGSDHVIRCLKMPLNRGL